MSHEGCQQLPFHHDRVDPSEAVSAVARASDARRDDLPMSPVARTASHATHESIKPAVQPHKRKVASRLGGRVGGCVGGTL